MFFSRVGRMEAKDCAKPAEWVNARRFFYWALRARVAQSSALNQIKAASPDSTAEYRTSLLNDLVADVIPGDNKALAETLESVDLQTTLTQLKAAHVTRQMLDLVLSNREAALDGFARSIDSLTSDEKARLVKMLQGAATERSPGLSYNNYHQDYY
jgi:acetyl-CoA carboxylase / biotin carboxylase 1